MGCREEGPALLFLSFPLTAARVEAQMEGLLLRLALAGPAGYLKNALLRSRLGCLHASRRRSRVWPGGGDGGMRGWTGNRFARLSPTSGLARMGRRRGAQLDGEFALGPRQEGAVEGRAAWARSLLFYISLTSLSMRGPAMLGHWSHLRL